MSNPTLEQPERTSDLRICTRTIKVGRIIRVARSGSSSVVPFIRLSGKWLEQAGFKRDDHLVVCVGRDEIRLIPQTREAADVGEE